MNYKSKYYRVLATLWVVLIIGGIFLWNIHSTLNDIHKEVAVMDKRLNLELLEKYQELGWAPYELEKK